MRRHLALVSIVVRDYDEALAFYVGVLGFERLEDSEVPEQRKRWVVVAPRGSQARFLLARAANAEQASRIGNQTGGRVFLFLETDDFERDFRELTSRGVRFVREPRHEPYGTVAVFSDLYGNLWDLIERKPRAAAEGSRNVEVKARVEDLAAVESRARAIASEGPVDLVQDDTFFACPNGRLKLRELADGSGELIHYLRADTAGPKTSHYSISPTPSPATLRETLARALGTAGRVRKTRRLYIAERTRIHLDTVEALGTFVELEVVLGEGEPPERGEAEARRILALLGIDASQLLEGAYLDLQAAVS